MFRRKSVWKGAVAGAVGGLAASWAMNEFQAAWSAVSRRIQQNGDSGRQRSEQGSEASEDATMKAAGAVAENVFGRQLTREQKEKASPVVHYMFGTAVGGLYGASSEKLPEIKSGLGLPFGTAVFLGADEIAVPALGLAQQSPAETRIQDHIYSLVSHLVYGATTELVRRGVRSYLR